MRKVERFDFLPTEETNRRYNCRSKARFTKLRRVCWNPFEFLPLFHCLLFSRFAATEHQVDRQAAVPGQGYEQW